MTRRTPPIDSRTMAAPARRPALSAVSTESETVPSSPTRDIDWGPAADDLRAEVVTAHEPSSPTVEPRTLTAWAADLHAAVCGCDSGGDVEGHGGVDFERVVDELEERIAIELAPSVRYPVAPKVWAATWGTLAATLGLTFVQAVLAHLELLPSLVGGDRPWVGVAVLVLGNVLPPLAAFLRAYLAEHQWRATDGAVRPPGVAVEGPTGALGWGDTRGGL